MFQLTRGKPSSDLQSVASGQPDEIPNARARRMLVGGFVLMVTLILTDGFMGFQTLLSIRRNVAVLTEHQFRNMALIDELQRGQSALGSVLYKLSIDASLHERLEMGQHVDRIEESLAETFRKIPKDDPDLPLWQEVERASVALTEEADRVLSSAEVRKPDLMALLNARERLLNATGPLIRSSHDRAEAVRLTLDETTAQQVTKDALLLTTCLVIACICGWIVVRTATRLYAQITSQAEELGQVTWQLLEKQESLARRLSHELHDELGQSLTALKTNLGRHATSGCADTAWLSDCSTLLKESIRSAHEISQLLRPTILDDFGLDSALAWLCERFEERNQIEVSYTSKFTARLDPAAETHIFRIAQEALTNIARHAQASRAEVNLLASGEYGALSVRDNGIGIKDAGTGQRRLGLTGMKARARSLGGRIAITSAPGAGVEIVLEFPVTEYTGDEEANPHPVGG